MGNVGRQILGAGVLIFVFLLFSGFVLWLPKRIRNLKQSLTVKWNARFQRLNYDLHNTLGFYTFLLLFFIAITGLYVTYPWVKNILIVSLGGESISSINAENKGADDAFAGLLSDMIQKQNEKKEEQNKRGNEYNKKAVPHLWKHKSGTASYFLHYSVVCFDSSFLQLPTSALSYTNRML